MTIEVDNYYPDSFKYKAIRLYDVPESVLLPHWNHTWRFIEEAKKRGGKCLVHCKMGISRSSATVCAYLMKHMLWNKEKALEYVKSCRSIISPNVGFLKQLDEYEGIVFASAQRHNKLFGSLSEKNLNETNTNEDRLTLPSVACPGQDNDDVTMTLGDFDLNRRLLDITNIALTKKHRPKSWSPDEARGSSYIINLSNNQELFHYKDSTSRYFRHQNFSEPIECLMLSSGDVERNNKLREKRKNFCRKRAHLRRHTVATPPLSFAVWEEMAFSEDSVFVHDGTVLNRFRRERRHTDKKSGRQRVSKQENRPDFLPVHKSSSCTRSKSPGHVKAAFEAPVDTTKEYLGSGVEITSSIPVREIVAVIESPVDDHKLLSRLASGTNLKSLNNNQFIKGHYKTASLPHTSFQETGILNVSDVVACDDSLCTDDSVRDRSFSETQSTSFSVKKLVTAIESGVLYDSGGDKDVDSESVNQLKSTADSTENSTENFALKQNTDSFVENIESTSFHTGSQQSSCSPKQVWCANTNNNASSNVLGDTPVKIISESKEKSSVKKKLPSLSPVMLRIIEKVGMKLMASSDRNATASLRSNGAESIAGGNDAGGSVRKRGVRHMVREIETTVRRFSARDSKSVQVPDAGQHQSSTPVALPPLLLSEDPENVLSLESKNRPDLRVRELVDRFDASPDESPASSPVKKASFLAINVSLPSNYSSDLVAPTPYRKPRARQSSRLDSSNLKRMSKTSVRRSQSDKIGTKSSALKRPGHSRSFRLNRSNISPPSQTVDCQTQTVDNSEKSLPLYKPVIILEKQLQLKSRNDVLSTSPVVKEMVTNIEKRFSRSLSSSSVHRSSSMPSSASTPSSRLPHQHRRGLRKTKSSPFLISPTASRQNLFDESD